MLTDPRIQYLAEMFRSRLDRTFPPREAPEYPVNDFADDPTMQSQQKTLAVYVAPADALRMGSGFMGAISVPLSRVLLLVPKSNMDEVDDALDLDDKRALVRQATEGPMGYEFRSGCLDIRAPSYHACAESLVRAARQYSLGVSSACCRAAIDLRRHDVKIRGSYVDHVAGQQIHGLYNIAKNLRASTEATREFVRAYERASDMLAVRRYLAAREAGDQVASAALREASAVGLFLRCGDLDE